MWGRPEAPSRLSSSSSSMLKKTISLAALLVCTNSMIGSQNRGVTRQGQSTFKRVSALACIMTHAAAELAVSKLLKAAGDKKKLGNEPRADEVRQLCESSLATLAKAVAVSDDAAGDATSEATAASVFVPFIVSLESKNLVLVEESLDGLNEVIAHGLMRDCADPRDAAKKLVDVLVAAVCGCGCMQDEKVQMYVVRVLQTAILSEPNYIHGASLLQSVRTCFNVHLGSQSPANQSAAKAALSRIINSMINRMEGLPPGTTKSPALSSEFENGR